MAIDLGGNYDFTLQIGGQTYGYMLFVDPQTGLRHWNEGLAPLLTPQHRITEFSYEHIPPEIDVPAAFENWADGAGFSEYVGNTAGGFPGFQSLIGNTPHGYSYSQGLDLSWDNRVYVSPARQTDNASTGGAIAAAPTQFWYSNTFGLWCWAGTNLYKFDLSSGAWVLKDTASAAYTSMAELSGVLYASVSGAEYHYSTDGTTWTTSTLGGGLSSHIVDYFTVRATSLWAIRLEALYTTTNGQNGGVNWSSGTSVGHTSETTQSMVVANNSIWIFKREGVYAFDGTTVSQVWMPRYNVAQNGKYSYVHYDGLIYVTYESRIISIDPFNTTTTPINIVYPGVRINALDPTLAPHDSQEIKGTISQMTGTFQDMYFTVTNPAGRTYVMKFDPVTSVSHTWAYLGTNTNTACLAVGPNVVNTTQPAVLTGYSTAAIHYLLPRTDLRPEDDPLYQFDTAQGAVFGPWLSFGARAFYKFLNRGTILAKNATAGQPIILSYALDDSDATQVLTTAVDNSLTQSTTATTVQFNRIRYYLTMQAASAAQSPVLIAATFHATLNPPRRRIWKPLVHIKENQELRDSAVDTQDATILKEALYAGASQRITMTDRHGVQFIVRILDIQEQALTPTREGGDERDSQVFEVTLAEVSTSIGTLPTGAYGADAWGEGKVYG